MNNSTLFTFNVSYIVSPQMAYTTLVLSLKKNEVRDSGRDCECSKKIANIVKVGVQQLTLCCI